MIDATIRARRRRDTGFTLIELLVVIVILGILGGVVVFAVRGTGDKGEANAKAADKRIVRTAMETFCARYGRYATSMAELVDGPEGQAGARGFLSEPSKHHSVVPLTSGPCNGTGYTLEPLDAPPPKCGDPGGWCVANPPNGHPERQIQWDANGIVQLPSGKVLAVVAGPSYPTTELFDPADGLKGSWGPGPQVGKWGGLDNGLTNNLVLLTGSHCSPNCGRVLALVGGSNSHPGPGKWALYDPDDGSAGSWTPVEGEYMDRYSWTTAAIQIEGPNCGSHCGKVLIVGQFICCLGTEPTTPPIAELYDPTDDPDDPSDGEPFEQIGSYNPPGGPHMALAPLADGRILVTGHVMAGLFMTVPAAALFDPATGVFSQAAAPLVQHWGQKRNPLAVLPKSSALPDGGILAIDNGQGKAEVFRPDQIKGPGSWAEIASCGSTEDSSEGGCYILGSLPDGTIVANGMASNQGRLYKEQQAIFLFEPHRRDAQNPYGTWRKTGSVNNPHSPGMGVFLDPALGGCASNCGNLLAIGGKNNITGSATYAELYVP